MENFILEYQIPDSELHICDDLIKYFHNDNTPKKQGKSGGQVQLDKKSSTDAPIYTSNFESQDYLRHLEIAFKIYTSKYPSYPKNTNVYNGINIQHYNPGEGFRQWHHERDGGNFPSVARNLVFMTYLNDVPNGGTEWMYQNYKSEAKKGLTVLWPSDFTHTHRGIISNTHEKYIITGWFIFRN